MKICTHGQETWCRWCGTIETEKEEKQQSQTSKRDYNNSRPTALHYYYDQHTKKMEEKDANT